MNNKTIIYIILFGVLGLIFGYLLFGKIAGEYLSLKTIFSFSQSKIESFGRNISGLTRIKQNILISGGIGAVIGILVSILRKK